MIYLIIYVIGYVLSYFFERSWLIKTWKNNWTLKLRVKCLCFAFFSWFAILFRVISNFVDWYESIDKNKPASW